MQIKSFNSVLKRAVCLAAVLLFGVGTTIAQQQVNLTAAPTSLITPDGSSVPMWGYSCGAAISTGSTATCAASNPKAGGGWSPVVITVPTGQDLQINLTNNLTFANGNSVPTSLTIVGQLGGGLGNSATSTASPDHSSAQSTVTWSTVAPAGTAGTPPVQAKRVQSFSTEVAAGATTSLTWTAPHAGTYLLESGTHPSIQGSMGLIGVVVVTAAPTVDSATGKTETAPGTAYPGVSYDAELPLIFSEIDPVQNKAVSAAVNTAGFSETMVWSGLPGGCGNPASSTYQQCYPPVVNYSPLYYLINGVAFDKTNVGNSSFAATPGTLAPVSGTGTVLVRLVNAGSRMHVPAIVGSTTGTASGGFSLIAEDGNPLPGLPRVQNEVFMSAGKTYDVMINAPAACTPVAPATTCSNSALPIYDRELSLSGNATARDAGMLAYIGINGSTPPGNANAVANPDTYNSVIAGHTLTVSDPSKGVIANDINVLGVKVATGPTQGTLTLNADGTFTYVASSTWATGDSFVYCANGLTTACAKVTLGPAPMEVAGGITVNNISYTSNVATFLKIAPPGILSVDKDAAGYPLTVNTSTVAVTSGSGLSVTVDPNGGFVATAPGAGTYTFTYKAQNTQGTQSAGAATVTLIFPQPSNLAVTVLDGADKTTQINDYRWIIEEDRTFYVDPKCTTNPLPAGCATVNAAGAPPVFGTNFHTSNMPVVAAGCTGALSCEGGQEVIDPSTGVHSTAVCDQGNGVCRPDTTGNGNTPVLPSQVSLDPTKRYYISIFPGDAAQPFIAGYSSAPDCSASGMAAGHCGHGMGGAPIAAAQNKVTVLTEPSPYPPATLSVFVFEDDFPLNGEHDAGGGIDVLSPQEPGLGGFQIILDDSAGGTGDPTGTPTYDMFNQPLTNSLAGTVDPATGFDACPIGNSRPMVPNPAYTATNGQPKMIPDQNAPGIIGMIITCPTYESDGKTLSPMAGQALVKNLYPGRYGVIAHPGADRIARGEEWLQTNTLDGQKAHDSFMRIGEPGYFQEFGPAGYHVTIGFANPAVINARKADLCPTGTVCNNIVKGHVSTARMSRTPDERLYGSGSHDAYAFTQCYASLGDPDGADFAFAKCDHDGNFNFTGIPSGNYKLTLFDQWNDQVVDGISTPIGLAGKTGATLDLGEVAVHQWQANFFSRTFLDLNGDGISNKDNAGNDTEPGLALVKTNVRFPDGSFSNRNNTDLNGYAAFNEEFPLFNWYVIETDVTRYKNTGTHVVYDAGGPTDGTPGGGPSTIAKYYANTLETVPLPTDLRVPGAVYCAVADCTGSSIALGPVVNGSSGPTSNLSTGRIDPPWVLTEGWQGFSGQNNFLEFGKKPYAAATANAPAENGGIRGHVIYSSTRPFDDPQFGTQNVWEPLVPNVTINLYQELTAPDGSTSLVLVDTTKTSSFDAWAQGFRSDGKPNMNCPGQTTTDPFFYGLKDQPNYLDWYNSQHGGSPVTPLPYDSQYKCYDGMHNWNQLQPAPYDGMYQFPSVGHLDPATGRPAGSNCHMKTSAEPWGCIPNPDSTDPFRYNTPMLPSGKYVTEVVVPPGFELTKEEDKNILIGDNFIAPATQQFGGLGNVFILPDQATVAAGYNPNNPQDPTLSLGRNPVLTSHEGDTPTVDTFWPCVGAQRTVPDYISLFPQSKQVAPFAGALRNLCDRKEVTLDDQTSAQVEFFIWTQTHIASKFTGVITDDFDAEFDPFSPQFGEKFAPAYLPVSIKDWAGNETERVYTDEFGIYNGMSYSTWEVNPPNPTGYAPTMMVTCMNDPGTGATPDPMFQPGYSNFCYELPFMPGATGYFDTPVVPTSAFGGGYNHPDCAYPDATPAIASVVSSDIAGPWVSAAGTGHTLKITALGDQKVESYGYSGPDITTAPFNQQKVTRHYGFGGTAGTVTIGGVTVPPANITTWSDTEIDLTVPTGVPQCALQQQAQYGGSSAQCGQLIIKAANGQQSVDSVTVTIGGKKPIVLAAGQTIQSVIDAPTTQPGDMIIVPPGTYSEMLIMWKPLRLQGVGAASSVIDANPHPAGKLDPWRREVVCLFGLALNGTPINGTTNPYDPNPNGFTCSDAMKFAVDRMPLEATVGWNATYNGNLAEQLIEPSLMGAYEGAGITVLAKGVKFTTTDPTVIWASDTFPAGTTLLTAKDCTTGTNGSNPYPSNFWCNPSRIDGLGVVNSSQGGGGILVHGWGHNLEIANNRIHSNQGTLSGGITVGQGEHPDLYVVGGAATATLPGSCETAGLPNQGLPYCFDMNVNIHNNAVTLNSSLGDELFSSTPAGAGGVTMCNGSDYYKFQYNWVCGNMSTGDGAGFAHLGFTKNGDVEHNSILFNQSTNPSITTNGGGLLVMGAPDQDPPCGLTTDKDCLSAPNTITPSDGTGPGLVINANLIMGNSADSGSGGGLRLQHVNGTDVTTFPNGALVCLLPQFCPWNSVSITNNIITNNVAGWDGGGVSLQDALNVNIINNTIASNDSTASAGPLFGSLFAPLASTPGVNCTTPDTTQSCPQVAGLVSVTNSPVLQANLPASGFTCPLGHGTNGSCKTYSVPILANNVFWQNRSFVVGISSTTATNTQYQNNVITLFNSSFTSAASTPASSQPMAEATVANGTGAIITGGTGACTPASYWDIGVRGDTGPSNHNGGTLTVTHSVITDAADYPNANNTGVDPTVVSQYCNGSRVPPELGNLGFMTIPGTNESNALPHPVFSLTPSATVDEGNNWVNLRWGPLAMTNPVNGSTLGNYGPASSSSAINLIPSTAFIDYALAPSIDFFGNPRKTNNAVDAGAVEFVAPNYAIANVTGGPLQFGNVVVGTTSASQTLTLHNTGGANLTGIAVAVTAPFSRTGGTCTGTLAPGTCTINVVFTPTATGPATGSVTITANVPVGGSPVSLSGTGIAAVRTATVTPATSSTAPFNFGTWAPGTTSSALTITVTNTGNVALAGGTVTGLAAPFSRTGGTCGATLPVGALCTINVVFSPTTTTGSPFNGSVSIAYTGATVTGSPVYLRGTAASMAVEPGSLSFGKVAIGSSPTQTLTIRNSTGSTRSIALGAFPAGFSRPTGPAGGTCGTTLNNNASCTVVVRFAPTSTTATYGGSLTITTNGGFTVANSPVTLSGSGVNIALTPNAVSLTSANGCGAFACASQNFTLTNGSGSTITGIATPTIAGATEFTFFGLTTTCGPAGGIPLQLVGNITLANNASCNITVVFAPPTGDTGVKTGTLSIGYTSGGQPATATASLTGIAQ